MVAVALTFLGLYWGLIYLYGLKLQYKIETKKLELLEKAAERAAEPIDFPDSPASVYGVSLTNRFGVEEFIPIAHPECFEKGNVIYEDYIGFDGTGLETPHPEDEESEE